MLNDWCSQTPATAACGWSRAGPRVSTYSLSQSSDRSSINTRMMLEAFGSRSAFVIAARNRPSFAALFPPRDGDVRDREEQLKRVPFERSLGVNERDEWRVVDSVPRRVFGYQRIQCVAGPKHPIREIALYG